MYKRQEADSIGEVAGRGAAAHGEGGGILAGHLVVGVDAVAEGGAVGLDVERLGSIPILQLCAIAQRSSDLCCLLYTSPRQCARAAPPGC